jgi:hypothetical protein
VEEQLQNAIQKEIKLVKNFTLHLKRATVVIKTFFEKGNCSRLMNPTESHLLTATALAKYLGN